LKLFKANKKEFNVGPFIKGVNFPLERFLLILLVLWLPLRELLFVGLSQLDQFGGLVAPVLVLITFLVLIARNGLKVKYGIVEVIFGIFLISSVISSLLSVTVYGQVWPVLKDLAVFFELFVLYLIGKNISREDFSTVVRIGITEAQLISIYGIWQFIVKVPVNPLWVVPGESLRARAFATFDSPNSLLPICLPGSGFRFG
jgi:hypothetical protein